jgi:hypothetical protein
MQPNGGDDDDNDNDNDITKHRSNQGSELAHPLARYGDLLLVSRSGVGVGAGTGTGATAATPDATFAASETLQSKQLHRTEESKEKERMVPHGTKGTRVCYLLAAFAAAAALEARDVFPLFGRRSRPLLLPHLAEAFSGETAALTRTGFAHRHPLPVSGKPTDPPPPPSSSSFALFMGRKKASRGRLSNLVDLDESDAEPAPRSSKQKKGTVSAKSEKGTVGVDVGISPLLALWAAGKETSEAAMVSPPSSSSPLEAARKSKSSSPRRQKQQARMEVEAERREQARELVSRIESMLPGDDDSGSGNSPPRKAFRVSDLLQELEKLVKLPTAGPSMAGGGGSLRQLLSAPAGSLNYRLAWAGSDPAICRLGTGLHKIKLARLQEVFLTVGPRGRVQMIEVIRVLGPFPNVKNTLVGTSSTLFSPPDNRKKKGTGPPGAADADTPRRTSRHIVIAADDDSSDRKEGVTVAVTVQPWRITWESLIDGTGKELLAGNQARNVNLEVLWSDENLLVCATIGEGEDDGRGRAAMASVDPPLFHDSGEDLLVFFRETRMEEKLDALRVI